MWELEITESPDKESCQKYIYCRDRITIGSCADADIIINDPLVEAVHLILDATPNGTMVSGADKNKLFLSNGKKIKGKKLHKVNDLLSIGNTKLKINAFVFQENCLHPDYLKKLYQKYVNERPDLHRVLEMIEKEILYLQFMENKTKLDPKQQ